MSRPTRSGTPRPSSGSSSAPASTGPGHPGPCRAVLVLPPHRAGRPLRARRRDRGRRPRRSAHPAAPDHRHGDRCGPGRSRGFCTGPGAQHRSRPDHRHARPLLRQRPPSPTTGACSSQRPSSISGGRCAAWCDRVSRADGHVRDTGVRAGLEACRLCVQVRDAGRSPETFLESTLKDCRFGLVIQPFDPCSTAGDPASETSS
ncbi:hypothetical protein Mnod_8707 (plasmid) [Methylobacterium nodulans ORS 2060]|uniref:Uncharacterized protein n=1 Tax=Methylobacterium nodulans (strain LMG 21967 / CNCM I-2342 / ORS 2060) TaxID=460265 RepID=B8IWH5_METNO|nr:hypothetical protein Mnod_8707 [Methylobacterium nodulans ORS 2060]